VVEIEHNNLPSFRSPFSPLICAHESFAPQVKTPALDMMRQIGTKLSIAERNVPALTQALGDSKSSVKTDSQNALLGFLAGGDSQTQIIRVDDLDEVADADSASIPHIGPLEGKILRGSDGRLYALEMTRLTPRDANYVKVSVTSPILLTILRQKALENLEPTSM
jgi:hypothetical protein